MSNYDTYHKQFKGLKLAGDEKALKSAYRKLAMKFHPDKNPGDEAAEAAFKAISSAYDDVKKGYYMGRPEWPGASRSAGAGASRGGQNADGTGSARGNTGNNHSGARSNSGGAGGKQQSGDAGARARADAKARAEEQAKAQAKAQAESLKRAAKVRAEKMQARTDQWAKVKATFGDAFKDPLGAMRGDKAPPKATNLGKASGAAKSPAGMATAAGIGAVVAGAVYVQSMAPKNVAASENPWLKNSVAQNQRGNPFLKNTRWQDRMQRAAQDNSASTGR